VRRSCDDSGMKQGRPSGSAENVAAARAHLTRRGILDDVHAERFVRPMKRVALDRFFSLRGRAQVISWIVARTRFFDELIAESLDGGIRQVIILAAGYDARAWRLAREGVRFIEVDHPATQARKKALAPSGGPEYIAADLSVQRLPNMLASYLTPSEPIVLICEGLTYFLAEADVRSLLSQAAQIAPAGSQLGVNFATTQEVPRQGRSSVGVTRLLQRWTREPLLFALHSDDAVAFLADCGWSAAEVLTHADLYPMFLRSSNFPEPPPVSSYVCKATK
jgi:methyltransferase (TIGR00027 family)